MGTPLNTGAAMIIFNLVTYDADAGEINLGYYATMQLALAKKKYIEKEYGRKFEKDEYEFRRIKVHTKMKSSQIRKCRLVSQVPNCVLASSSIPMS